MIICAPNNKVKIPRKICKNNKKPTILGLLFGAGDPAAALIQDGKIIAMVEEERFTRNKHDHGIFPLNATNYCLEQGKIDIKNIDFSRHRNEI